MNMKSSSDLDLNLMRNVWANTETSDIRLSTVLRLEPAFWVFFHRRNIWRAGNLNKSLYLFSIQSHFCWGGTVELLKTPQVQFSQKDISSQDAWKVFFPCIWGYMYQLSDYSLNRYAFTNLDINFDLLQMKCYIPNLSCSGPNTVICPFTPWYLQNLRDFQTNKAYLTIRGLFRGTLW